MQLGDEAFFYHSNTGKEAVGICRVTRTAYPDPTDETGKWVAVSVAPVGALARSVSLADMKVSPGLSEFQLLRQSRLSVVPVRDSEWTQILSMAEA
jgi:predicted RNA-binding protein with PUA-like domain